MGGGGGGGGGGVRDQGNCWCFHIILTRWSQARGFSCSFVSSSGFVFVFVIIIQALACLFNDYYFLSRSRHFQTRSLRGREVFIRDLLQK